MGTVRKGFLAVMTIRSGQIIEYILNEEPTTYTYTTIHERMNVRFD